MIAVVSCHIKDFATNYVFEKFGSKKCA